jgi:hypothetical protein
MQFDGLSRAASMVEAFERRHERRFDYVVRLRDDAHLLQPLALPARMRQMTAANAHLMTARCHAWGGYNDLLYIIARAHLDTALRGQLRLAYTHDERATRFPNPEYLLMLSSVSNDMRVVNVAPCELPAMTLRINDNNDDDDDEEEEEEGRCIDARVYRAYVEGARCDLLVGYDAPTGADACRTAHRGLIPPAWLAAHRLASCRD